MRCGAYPEKRWMAMGLPAGLLALLIAAATLGSRDRTSAKEQSRPKILSAGFVHVEATSREGSYAGVHASREAGGGERHVSIRVPSMERAEELTGREDEITVAKSTMRYEIDFDAGRREWKHLSREVRRRIDEAWIRPGRWRTVVVHASATESGSAKIFELNHRRVRKLSNGLAYHFVIGNGTFSGDGEVEVGDRWVRQESGEASREAAAGEVIDICLVGDFDAHAVNEAQLEALDELTDYLQARAGVMALQAHAGLEEAGTSCPGRFFPAELLAP